MTEDGDTAEEDPMYDAERRTRMVELSNKLSLADLAVLIDISADRIEIYAGSINKHSIGGELSSENPVCLNGAFIQINGALTDLEDMQDNEFVREAIQRKKETGQ